MIFQKELEKTKPVHNHTNVINLTLTYIGQLGMEEGRGGGGEEEGEGVRGEERQEGRKRNGRGRKGKSELACW